MFKKMAFVLLALNLLTPKPVVAIEPVSLCVGILVGAAVGYPIGYESGEAAAIRKEKERKAAKRKAKELLPAAKNDYKKCRSDKWNSGLGRDGVNEACAHLYEKQQALKATAGVWL